MSWRVVTGRRLSRFAAAAVPIAALGLAGCAVLPDGRGWGADATVTPGWHRVGRAAVEAAESPRFWGPLAAAAVFQIDGWDRKVSDWGRRRTPIFGSERNAAHWSDRLRSASSYAYLASVIATPSGDDPEDWLLDKLRGAAVGFAAVGATDEESHLLKNVAARERPNGQDAQSMPSSHTSRSAALTALAERNVATLPLGAGARSLLDFGLDALTYGTAWARVESGFHFPSDTLVGMSIGNFNGSFFNDAFLGLGSQDRLAWTLSALPEGAGLRIDYRF
ncbi:MAG: phosphatase PAP2 family protein [Steroidobacteraceae bacterium]